MLAQLNPREIAMTDEDRIMHLMNEQSRLTAEIAPLQTKKRTLETTGLRKLTHRDEIVSLSQQINRLTESHSKVVRELIDLLYDRLKDALGGFRSKMDQAGVQYTEMVHDFFVKLPESEVDPIV